jgi:hypothetical protein
MISYLALAEFIKRLQAEKTQIGAEFRLAQKQLNTRSV